MEGHYSTPLSLWVPPPLYLRSFSLAVMLTHVPTMSNSTSSFNRSPELTLSQKVCDTSLVWFASSTKALSVSISDIGIPKVSFKMNLASPFSSMRGSSRWFLSFAVKPILTSTPVAKDSPLSIMRHVPASTNSTSPQPLPFPPNSRGPVSSPLEQPTLTSSNHIRAVRRITNLPILSRPHCHNTKRAPKATRKMLCP
jgi:hypothetical protein